MENCFTKVYKHLSRSYNLPKEWNGYTNENMDLFVEKEKKFLAKKEHILFFKSFCKKVKYAKRDDIVLTKTSVGCAVNEFVYWVWSEDKHTIVLEKLDKDCLIMRINNG
jgi:hypothetical protein